MSESIRTASWAQGANNLAAKDRLPEGTARDIVNADPTPGGKLELRIGYEKVSDGTAMRGVLALGSKLLIADGATLVEYNTETDTARTIRTIAGAGAFVGDVLDNELYFCTENECLRYDGNTVKPWGVPDVNAQPLTTSGTGGSLQLGYYQLAMTYTDADGLEGGTDKPLAIYAPDHGALTVHIPTPPPGCTANLYVGSLSGETLYLQATSPVATTIEIGAVRDDTARCTTILMRAPIPGTQVTAHNGVLALAVDNLVQITMPLRKHLINRANGFFQYGTPIGMLLSVGDSVLVSADKTYALDAVETAGVRQRTLLEYPAVAGTAVLLPSGQGAWMTKYGQVLTDGQSVQSLNRDSFAPVEASAGAAGVVDHNGNQLVVTTLQGSNKPNALAATDFFIGEIEQP